MTCPRDSLGRPVCRTFIYEQFRALDKLTGDTIDVVISTAPPLVESPYGAAGYTCPHGITYWAEPTSEQIAVWAKNKVL